MTSKPLWNEAYFCELYNKYYRVLTLYAMNFTKDQTRAEDIVQDVFSSLWMKAVCHREEQAIRTYLYHSTRNKAFDLLKHDNVEESYARQTLLASPDLLDDSNEAFSKEAVYARLFHTIDQLPSRQREIFLLAMKGEKNKDIADALNISIETVKTQKRRAISSLKSKISDKDFVFLLLFLAN